MQYSHITLDFPTVPAPLMATQAGRSLTQRLNEDAGFLHVYLRDGLNLIQPFQTQAHYARFLTVQHHMLCDLQGLYAETALQRVVGAPGLIDTERSSRIEADLRDLGAWPPRPVPPEPAGSTMLEALGWIYATEGLMLSLDMLAQTNRVAMRLGFTPKHGGHHLSAPIDLRKSAWRNFAQALDTQQFSHEQGTAFVAGACQAYHRLDQLVSLVLTPRQNTE